MCSFLGSGPKQSLDSLWRQGFEAIVCDTEAIRLADRAGPDCPSYLDIDMMRILVGGPLL